MVFISFLRGINVTGNHMVKMEALRRAYERQGFKPVKTLINSGNVVFAARAMDEKKLASKIEGEIEREFGFRPAVMLRTTEELRTIVEANPFNGRDGIHPSKLVVMFLCAECAPDAAKKVRALTGFPEEVHVVGRELFVYFPNGQGKATLKQDAIDRALGAKTTARNWNTTTKLLALAEEMERAVR